MHGETRFPCTSTPLSDVRFPIDTERPLTALKNLHATGSSAEPQISKIVDDRPRRRNNAGDPQVPVFVSRASITRLARISTKTEAIRSGTAFRSPYFSSAWMCPGQRWPTLKCRCRQLIDLWEFPRPGWWSPRWPVWVAFVLRVLDPNRAIQTGSDLGHQ